MRKPTYAQRQALLEQYRKSKAELESQGFVATAWGDTAKGDCLEAHFRQSKTREHAIIRRSTKWRIEYDHPFTDGQLAPTLDAVGAMGLSPKYERDARKLLSKAGAT